MRRLSGHAYVGFARYTLTFCTRRRQRFFESDALVDLAL